MFRLLALDVDGTLLTDAKGISPRTRSALAAARAQGVRLVLVTGRRYPSARRVAEDLGGAVPLVLHNGALIIDDGSVLRCKPLALQVAREAIRIGRAAGADAVAHCGPGGEGRLLAEDLPGSATLLAYGVDTSHPDVTVVGDLARDLLEDPLQIMFGGGLPEMERLRVELMGGLGTAARVDRTLYPSRRRGFLEVLSPEVGKAEAVSYLQRRWGFSADETLAIGDNWNDHEMLQRAGLGLVMGNADPEMLGLGLPVLPTNEEDGVAVALETHVLAGSKKEG